VRNQFSAVVFDFDGTLVDSALIKRQVFFDVAEALPGARELIFDLLANQPPLDRYQIFSKVAEQCCLPEDAPHLATELARQYSEICHEKVIRSKDVPGADVLIKVLKNESIPVFVSSATPITELEKIISKRSWAKKLSGIYGSPTRKIDHLRDIYSQIQGDKRLMVMVGDSDSDADAAEEFGCQFAAVGENFCSFKEALFRGQNLHDIRAELFD
jgi:phosphoglycolate phosphatase-like HAD superfamily hydrolase